MKKFQSLFPHHFPVIAMIHVQAMPGTPGSHLSSAAIINQALAEAKLYLRAGVDGIMIENMHDIPYVKENPGPEITALMSIIAHELRKATTLPLGIQVLAAANRQALAIAKAAGLNFIRAEGFVFGHLADEGWIDAQAGALLRYRRYIEAEGILVLTDVKKKHSAHEISRDVSLLETAKAAEFFKSDGVVITGKSTAHPADENELLSLRNELTVPVLVGSGITVENIGKYSGLCDGVIVGSHFKKSGYWKEAPEQERVEKFMETVKKFRD